MESTAQSINMTLVSQGAKVMPVDGWKIAEVLWVLLNGVLVWLGQRAVARLDRLEHKAVLKEDFDKAIGDIKAERSRMHTENLLVLERIEKKIDVAAQATIVER